jgi:hypothetical protein
VSTNAEPERRPLPVPRTVSPALLGRLDHWWMTRAACVRRPELPWTEDAHRVEDEIREAMARVCRTCPVRRQCVDYSRATHASAGFWGGGFRGGAYTGDLLDLLAELDEDEVRNHYALSAAAARHVHRKALAS